MKNPLSPLPAKCLHWTNPFGLESLTADVFYGLPLSKFIIIIFTPSRLILFLYKFFPIIQHIWCESYFALNAYVNRCLAKEIYYIIKISHLAIDSTESL